MTAVLNEILAAVSQPPQQQIHPQQQRTEHKEQELQRQERQQQLQQQQPVQQKQQQTQQQPHQKQQQQQPSIRQMLLRDMDSDTDSEEDDSDPDLEEESADPVQADSGMNIFQSIFFKYMILCNFLTVYMSNIQSRLLFFKEKILGAYDWLTKGGKRKIYIFVQLR